MSVRSHKRIFLSAVSTEFRSYRTLLADDLKRPNLEVKTQEDIERVSAGGTTLHKLDVYIRGCDGVVHLIGDAAGKMAPQAAVQALLEHYPKLPARLPMLAKALAASPPEISYTQWEAYLAIYHRIPLYIYLAAPDAPRDPTFQPDEHEKRLQHEHLQRIKDLGRDRGCFANQERLSSMVLRDLHDILPPLRGRARGRFAAAVAIVLLLAVGSSYLLGLFPRPQPPDCSNFPPVEPQPLDYPPPPDTPPAHESPAQVTLTIENQSPDETIEVRMYNWSNLTGRSPQMVPPGDQSLGRFTSFCLPPNESVTYQLFRGGSGWYIFFVRDRNSEWIPFVENGRPIGARYMFQRDADYVLLSLKRDPTAEDHAYVWSFHGQDHPFDVGTDSPQSPGP
jgi:hypothetical protein